MNGLLAALCYMAAISAGTLVAIPQAILISRDKPIRHGRWLALYLVVGGITTWLAMPTTKLALLVLPGMAGVFSAVFRSTLNDLRGLPWHYMGPDPADSVAPGRSIYDLTAWRIARLLRCRPVHVALFVELGTAAAVCLIITICRT